MKYYLVAGEASGDLHGANLISALKKEQPTAEFRAWGGDLIQAQGATLVKHYKEASFMGFISVVKNLPGILRNIKLCKRDIAQFKPDVAVLIDYPGFNFELLPFLKKQKIRVVYYIAPQTWAWKKSRVYTLKKFVDTLLVILPFEKPFFEQYGLKSHYVGHPLFDYIKAFKPELTLDDFSQRYRLKKNKPIISILPGSRKQEIEHMLPVMINTASGLDDTYQYVIAGAPGQNANFYAPFTKQFPVVTNDTYTLLHYSHAALVTSGTATLETALFNVPQVVCYKTDAISYQIAKRIIKLPYISLVNLILDKPCVKELIQNNFNEIELKKALKNILSPTTRANMLEDYTKLKNMLGEKGAAQKAAHIIQHGSEKA